MKSSKTIVLQSTDTLTFDFTNRVIKLNGTTIQMDDNGTPVDLSFEDYYCQLNIEDSSTGWRDLVISCNSDFGSNINYQMRTLTNYGESSGQIGLTLSSISTSYGDKISFIIGTTDQRMEMSHHQTESEFSIENDQGILIKFDHNGDDYFNLWYGLS
ncbi:MAG: hypothetical protein DHS20C18_26690 [Saprospiraceae bacterium]|nr:MAG: hypothetical protein DHS20C18_26690 [Saprospiraceae bacterium]